jgi:hypothetical protein
VGSRLQAVSSSASVTDPWPGWSDLDRVRMNLAEPSTEERRRRAATASPMGCGPLCGAFAASMAGCGTPRAGAVDYLGGGVRRGTCRRRLPR